MMPRLPFGVPFFAADLSSSTRFGHSLLQIYCVNPIDSGLYYDDTRHEPWVSSVGAADRLVNALPPLTDNYLPMCLKGGSEPASGITRLRFDFPGDEIDQG